MSRVLCKCGGELAFTVGGFGRSIEVCSICGPRPLLIIRPQPETRSTRKDRGGNCGSVSKWAHLTDDEAIQMLRSLGKELGRTPTRDEMTSCAELPAPSFYRKRFGSVRDAITLAGLEYRATRNGGEGRTASMQPLNVWQVA